MQINQESGRTMMEMIGVIAIIGVLTIGAISTVNYGLEAFRVSSAHTLVETTANNVSDLYSWKRSFPTQAQAQEMRNTICQNKVFDEECISEETNKATVATAWGYLQVEPDDRSNPEFPGFKITLTNVPYMACNQLLGMKWTNVILDTSSCNEDTDDAKTEMVFFGN